MIYSSLKSPNAVRAPGFVLVAVVWLLASMTLLVGYIAKRVEGLQQQSFIMERRGVAALDRLAIESVVLYLASTRTSSNGGLRTEPFESTPIDLNFQRTNFFEDRGDEIRLDNRAYLVKGGHLLRIQDAGSLVSLMNERHQVLRSVLEEYGIPRPEVERLIATLIDYIDRDDIVSLNGAEKYDYQRKGMLPPTNRFLVSPWQLYNIIGWSPYLDRFPELLTEVTVTAGGQENYNTMTIQSVTRHTGDNLSARRVLDYRASQSFSGTEAVAKITGNVRRDPFGMSFVPSRYLRLELTDPVGSKAEWIGITLTPGSTLSPWEIDFRVPAATTMEYTHEDFREVGAVAPPTTLLE